MTNTTGIQVGAAGPWYSVVFEHSGKCLAVAGDSGAEDAGVVQATCDGRPSQQWALEPVGDTGRYRIRARHSGMLLEVAGRSEANGGKIRQGADANDQFQQWTLDDQGDGYYLLRSHESGRVIDVPSSNASEGSAEGLRIQQWGTSSRWNRRVRFVAAKPAEPFVPEPGAWYRLSFAHSGKALDDYSWKTEDGSELVQYEYRINDNQQFCFEEVEPGWYRIRCRWSGLAIVPAGRSTASGAAVHQWSPNGNVNQQWRVETDGYDAYRVISRNSGHALAVEESGLGDRAKVIQRQLGPEQSSRVHIRKVADALPETTATVLSHSVTIGGTRFPPLHAAANRKASVELCLRPDADLGSQTILVLGDYGHNEIHLRREDRNLIVATKSGEDYETVLTAETALKRNRWQHVALTVDFSIESSFQNQTRVRFDVTLYLDGVVAGAAAAIEHGALERSANAMFGVLGKRLLRGCVLGSRVDDREAFAGRFTELRFWRGVRSAEAIAELFRRRARGDEPGLAACYRLDGIDDGRLLDCGPARAHAIAGSGVNTPGATNAPVPATAGSHVGRVDVRDRLRKEWLPKAAFSSADLREILDRDGVVGELGTVNGARVETSIYELVLRPVDGNGAAVDTAVIYLEETQVAIVSDVSGPPRTEQWAKGYHLIPTGSSGEARLRFVARGLASSRVYVRHAGMHNRVWTPLAPDRRNADKLMAVRPERLLGLESSPTTGGTTTGGTTTGGATTSSTTTGGTAASVLSPTATMADAVAATNMIRAMARVGLSPSAAGSQPTSGGGDFLGMGDYFEDISGAVEDGGKAAFQAVKSAASLASDVGLDLAKILEEAPVYMGKQAVENCIATAEQLRVLASPAAELVNVVQIVGERWVDGVKQSFRVLVREFEEAWAAIDAFFTRIGGKIRDFINMLADALDWSKFLATADRVYGEILGAFEEVEASVADQLPANGESTSAWASRLAGELGSGLDPLRAWSPSAVSFQAALTRPLPVVDASQIPGYEEVTWLMDKLTELMKSAKFKLSLPTLDIGDALPDWLDELVEAAPSLDFAGDPLGIDMVTLVQTLVDLWDRLIDNLLKDVWKPILKLVQGAVSGIQAGLTKRINIPFLTELIESTVLGGRELNMLRMLSLVGAVPLRLWEIAQGVAAGGGGQGGGGGIDAGGIASGVISIFNSLATATRTLPGLDIPEGLYQAQFGTAHGALIIVQGILDAALNFGRLPAVGGFVNVFYGIATTALGGGSWFAMNQGYYYENGLDKTTEKLLTRIDVLAGLAWFGLSAIEWGTKGDQGIDPWKESGYWAAAYFVMGTGRVASKSKHPLASVVTLEMAIAALLLNLGYMTDTIVDLGRAN